MDAVAGPVAGLRRLRALADIGGLDELCERHGIAVLTVFGSTAQGSDRPRDLDIGVLLERGRTPDYLPLIGDLQDAADGDIDLVVLARGGPVIRERALVGAVALYESRPGAWLEAATLAALERMDTAWMRRLDLDLLAQLRPRSLDPDSITARLRGMRRFLDVLPGDVSAAELAADYERQLLVERILSALVDLAVAVNTHVAAARLGAAPHDMKLSFRAAADAGMVDRDLAGQLAESVGLRNVLIHAYLELDVGVLAAAIPLARQQYGAYVVQVARWLRDQPPD